MADVTEDLETLNLSVPPSLPQNQIYTPLKSWETRLLRLLPDEASLPLRCELHPAALLAENGLGVPCEFHPVEYTALSYSWGWPERTAGIICNGTVLGIPPPLAAALKRLRSTEDSIWLWCDAVCIHQENLDEKAAQVKQMLRIFSKAERVVAWLGEPAPGTSGTLTVIPTLADERRDWKKAKLLIFDSESDWAVEMPDAIQELLRRSWFSRTWIRQETFAARSLHLQVGHICFAFESLLKVVQMRDTTGLPGLWTPQLESLRLTYETLRLNKPNPDDPDETLPSRACWILCQNRHFDVCDDRDRIYALTGMMDSVPAFDVAGEAGKRSRRVQNFPIDYTMSPSEVYQSFTKFLIRTEKNLNCLEVFGDRPQQGDVPSWSTDWRKESFYNSFEAYSIPKTYQDTLPHEYPAENTTGARYLTPLRTEDWVQIPHADTNELHLYGHRLGSIRRSQVVRLEPYAWRYFYEWRVHKGRERDTVMSTVRGKLNDCLVHETLILLSMNTTEVKTTVGERLGRFLGKEELLCGVLVSPGVQDGDIVVQLVGSRMIHVVRPRGCEAFSLVCAGWLWRSASSYERSRLHSFSTLDRDSTERKVTSKRVEVKPDVVLYGDVNNFTYLSIPSDNAWGPGSQTFRNRVHEVTGISTHAKARETTPSGTEHVARSKRPTPELFVLI